MMFRPRFKVLACLDAVLDFRRRPDQPQGQKFDPHGAYILRFLPELERVPNRWIHHAWGMPRGLQRRTGCAIGSDSPAPHVERARAREQLLDATSAARRRAPGEAG